VEVVLVENEQLDWCVLDTKRRIGHNCQNLLLMFLRTFLLIGMKGRVLEKERQIPRFPVLLDILAITIKINLRIPSDMMFIAQLCIPGHEHHVYNLAGSLTSVCNAVDLSKLNAWVYLPFANVLDELTPGWLESPAVTAIRREVLNKPVQRQCWL
jgi:hypothetical protein